MEEKRLSNTIHGTVFNKNILKIQSVKDFYTDITKVDISNMNMEIVNENKTVFEWILENPDYDFNSLFETHHTNEELLRYFKIYYQNLVYIIDRYHKKDFIIKPDDLFKIILRHWS